LFCFFFFCNPCYMRFPKPQDKQLHVDIFFLMFCVSKLFVSWLNPRIF
jgi:hypothetical protein